jgi:hypothetical protein
MVNTIVETVAKCVDWAIIAVAAAIILKWLEGVFPSE